MLEERGNFTLFLVDTLRAKLYIAGDRCLAGSANVTLAALGKGNASRNIEVLVETNTTNPAIVSTLDEITKAQRPATQAMAQVARRLANNLSDQVETSIGHEYGWFPASVVGRSALLDSTGNRRRDIWDPPTAPYCLI